MFDHFPGHIKKPSSLFETFYVQEDDLGILILCKIGEIIGDSQIPLVAHGDELTIRNSPGKRSPQGNTAKHPALAEKSNIAFVGKRHDSMPHKGFTEGGID